MSNLEDIRLHASNFRAAMETLRDNPERYAHLHYAGSNLNTFPVLWCDYSSEMLNAYLKSKGHHQFNIVTAFKLRGSRKCHVWLSNGDIIIDITADQFGKRKYPKVWICKPDDYSLQHHFRKVISSENITHTHFDPVQQKQNIFRELEVLLAQQEAALHQ
jgi:hypothetical protein